MKARFFFIISLFFLLLTSCGLPIPTNLDLAQQYVCLESSKDFSACCLDHGGAQVCAVPVVGYFFRSGDKALVCNDGTVSTGCKQ